MLILLLFAVHIFIYPVGSIKLTGFFSIILDYSIAFIGMSTKCNEMAVKHCNEYLLGIQNVLEAHVLVMLKALI